MGDKGTGAVGARATRMRGEGHRRCNRGEGNAKCEERERRARCDKCWYGGGEDGVSTRHCYGRVGNRGQAREAVGPPVGA